MSTPPLSRKEIQAQVVELGWTYSHNSGRNYVYHRGGENPLRIPQAPEVGSELAQKILKQAQRQ